jgi:hypothetical protein
LTDEDLEAPIVEERPPNRSIALGLALVAAVLLVGAAFTRHWLVNGNGRGQELGIGLRSMYLCADSGRIARTGYSGANTCVDRSNADFVKMVDAMSEYTKREASNAFVPAGVVTFAVVLLAAGGLVAAAALAARKKRNPIPIAPTTISLLCLMTALISGCVFVATKPGPTGSAGVGLSFWAFGVGAVIGIAGSQMLAKLNRMD